jgi:four helix bundle protein
VENKRIEQFEDLLVWQKGLEIIKQIYLITREGPLSKDFALRDQVRRAALSITSNIAEGFERASRKEYLNFLNIAKGSAGEVRSLLRAALEIGYLDQTRYEGIQQKILELSRFLANQIKSLKGSVK